MKMRLITVKYDGACQNCEKPLEVGQEAMYEKSCGIFCVPCAPTDTEEIRHFRTLKAEAKAERLDARAGRLKGEAKGKMADFNRMRGDLAFVTQPGHFPWRDKILNRYDKGLELLGEARELEDRAQNICKVRMKGDAEKLRQKKRDFLDTLISKGSRVTDFAFGPGVVVSVHKKSYRIKFDGRCGDPWTCSRDKSYVRPLEGSSNGK